MHWSPLAAIAGIGAAVAVFALIVGALVRREEHHGHAVEPRRARAEPARRKARADAAAAKAAAKTTARQSMQGRRSADADDASLALWLRDDAGTTPPRR